MPAGVRFPLRMTGIRLPDGSMWLHSPVAIDDAIAEQIERLGPVRHIVAPSLIHNVHAAGAKALWPDARLYGAVGLREKLPALEIDQDLGPVPPASWGGVLAPFPIEGAPAVNEVPANLQTDAILWIMGSRRQFRSSRLWAWRFTEDRAAVADSVRRVLDQDFDRVVPCHGEIVDHDAEAALQDATEPLLV
jgi:hypothetical protein